MDISVSFGHWVRQRRKALDLTQAALAHKSGCAVVTIKKIEQDERRPSRQMAMRLADVLAVPQSERDLFIQAARGESLTEKLPAAQKPQPFSARQETTDPDLSTGNATAGFVGRKRELAWLQNHLNAALQGDHRIVFITGEAGSGKTTLLAEFARLAAEKHPDLLVASVGCSGFGGANNPYMPVCDLLGLFAGDLDGRAAGGISSADQVTRLWNFTPTAVDILLKEGPALLDFLIPARAVRQRLNAFSAHLMIDLPEPDESLVAGAEPGLWIDGFCRMIRGFASRAPLLLIMDDMQWIDSASVQLLFQLTQRLAGTSVFFIGAYRPEDVNGAAQIRLSTGAARHPLVPVLLELQRRHGDIQINLDTADETERQTLVNAILDREPNQLSDEFRKRMAHHTGGLPLFTIELLKSMQNRGELVRDAHKGWKEGKVIDWEQLPVRVEAVIAQRIAQLDPSLQKILAAASVEGELFSLQMLSSILEIPEKKLLNLLSESLQGAARQSAARQSAARQSANALIREAGEVGLKRYQPGLKDSRHTRFQFKHVLFQQYLYQSLPETERRWLHGEIAHILENSGDSYQEATLSRLARHFLFAGQVDKAASYYLQAGDHARTLYAFQEAVSNYRKALELLPALNDPQMEARTWIKLGLTYQIASDFEASSDAFQRGLDLWQRAATTIRGKRLPSAPHPLRLTWQDPPSLDPTLGGWNMSAPVLMQLFSGLVAHSADLEVVPDVAQRWEVLEDGRRYIFYLREDVFWSDGAPVSAWDFAYTFKRALDPKINAPVAGELLSSVVGAREYQQDGDGDTSQIGIRAINDTTLEIELEEPAVYFLQELSYYVMLPVPRHVVERHGADWTSPENFVSNGPFRLADYHPGEFMLLERNPAYHGEFSGNLEQVHLSMVQEPEKMRSLYENNELDVLFNWFISGRQLDSLRQKYPHEYSAQDIFGTVYLILDPAIAPFTDKRVRQAFAMSIDRDALVAEVSQGYARPAAGGFVPPGMPGHAADIGLKFNPSQARRLLEQAVASNGNSTPDFSWIAYGMLEEEADFINRQWRSILGVDTKAEIVDRNKLLEKMHTLNPPVMIGGWRADYADPDNFLRVNMRVDLPHWRDPYYEALLEKARKTRDQDLRLSFYRQADEHLMNEAVLVPLTYLQMHLMCKPWVKKYPLTAIKNPGFWKDVVFRVTD